MNLTLQRLFDLLEADRRQLFEKVSQLSPEQFNHAVTGKWSIGQILAHLITAERMSLHYMRKKVLGINRVRNTGITEEVKMILLRGSQRLPLKFKAPRTVVEQTPVYPEFQQLRADWDKERADLREFLEHFEDHHLKKKIYRHIRAGRLNIRHALIFFREHHIHHWPQIKQLL